MYPVRRYHDAARLRLERPDVEQIVLIAVRHRRLSDFKFSLKAILSALLVQTVK